MHSSYASGQPGQQQLEHRYQIAMRPQQRSKISAKPSGPLLRGAANRLAHRGSLLRDGGGGARPARQHVGGTIMVVAPVAHISGGLAFAARPSGTDAGLGKRHRKIGVGGDPVGHRTNYP